MKAKNKKKYATGGDTSKFNMNTVGNALSMAGGIASLFPGAGPAIGIGASALGTMISQFSQPQKPKVPQYTNTSPFGYAMGGDLNALNSNALQVEADNPNQTDSVDAGKVMLDDQEVVTDTKVFSNKLIDPMTNQSFAKLEKVVQSSKGKFEKFQKSTRDSEMEDDFFYDKASEANFERQEKLAQVMGLRAPDGTPTQTGMKYGGKMGYALGGKLKYNTGGPFPLEPDPTFMFPSDTDITNLVNYGTVTTDAMTLMRNATSQQAFGNPNRAQTFQESADMSGSKQNYTGAENMFSNFMMGINNPTAWKAPHNSGPIDARAPMQQGSFSSPIYRDTHPESMKRDGINLGLSNLGLGQFATLPQPNVNYSVRMDNIRPVPMPTSFTSTMSSPEVTSTTPPPLPKTVLDNAKTIQNTVGKPTVDPDAAKTAQMQGLMSGLNKTPFGNVGTGIGILSNIAGMVMNKQSPVNYADVGYQEILQQNAALRRINEGEQIAMNDAAIQSRAARQNVNARSQQVRNANLANIAGATSQATGQVRSQFANQEANARMQVGARRTAIQQANLQKDMMVDDINTKEKDNQLTQNMVMADNIRKALIEKQWADNKINYNKVLMGMMETSNFKWDPENMEIMLKMIQGMKTPDQGGK